MPLHRRSQQRHQRHVTAATVSVTITVSVADAIFVALTI
jgi:hypothetical protein